MLTTHPTLPTPSPIRTLSYPCKIITSRTPRDSSAVAIPDSRFPFTRSGLRVMIWEVERQKKKNFGDQAGMPSTVGFLT